MLRVYKLIHSLYDSYVLLIIIIIFTYRTASSGNHKILYTPLQILICINY